MQLDRYQYWNCEGENWNSAISLVGTQSNGNKFFEGFFGFFECFLKLWNFCGFFAIFAGAGVEQVEHISDMVGHQALIIWCNNRTIEWCWLDTEWIRENTLGVGKMNFENAWV